jgi:hypothetical protein
MPFSVSATDWENRWGFTMELQVRYADWLVGDGDEPVVVGSSWRVTLELQRDGPVTPEDWHPVRAFATQQVEIAAIEYLPGRYRRDRFDRRSYHLVEWGEARPVTSTHDLGTTLRPQTTELDGGLIEKVGSGVFVLTCRRAG